MNPLCNTLILDFGGVITQTLFETHDQTEATLGLSKGSLTWRGPFEPAGDALWQEMVLGKISERDYWTYRARQTGALLGKNWSTMSDFVIAARSKAPLDVIRPEFFSNLERVQKAGVKCAILSNELDLFYGADFRDKLPFLQSFDAIIDATYTKILKPDPRAYQAICDTLQIKPSCAVFVDDQPSNVKGAQDFGMQTVHFDVKNPQQSYQEALHHFGIGKYPHD